MSLHTPGRGLADYSHEVLGTTTASRLPKSAQASA
jgi:hypothetical protein